MFAEILRNTPLDKIPKEEAKYYRLMHTSGTTGLPLPIVYTKRPDWNDIFLGEGERIVMAFGSKTLRLDFARAYADSDTPNADILFLNIGLPEKTLSQICEQFRPTTFVCPPSILLRLTQKWTGMERQEITSISVAGELAGKAAIEEMRARFPNAKIINTYSSMETGNMGLSCPKCAWNEFHPRAGVIFDIDEPDEDGVGDLLVTKDNPGGVAFRSYRIGDVASHSSHDGEKTIRLYGRRGFDYIKLAEALLIREEFDRVARELKDHIRDYKAEVQSVVKDGAPLHKLRLYVVPETPSALNEAALEKFLETEFPKRLFVTPKSTLSDAIAKGIFAPLEIKVEEKITHATAKPQRLYLVN